MASDPRKREAEVVALLRFWTGFACALGAAAIALGYVDVIVTDADYLDHVERAGSDWLTLFTSVALLPAVLVFRRPQWGPIVLWLCWLMPWLVFALDGIGPHRQAEMGGEVSLVIMALLAALFCTVFVVLPIVRSLHKSPPRDNLPAARIVTT